MQLRYSEEIQEITPDLKVGDKSTEWLTIDGQWHLKSNLTRSQLLIWLGLQLNPDTPLYNMIHASTICGTLDPTIFAKAFQALVNDSDAMRTTITTVNGIPQQQVLSEMQAELEMVDLSGDSDVEKSYQSWLDSRKRQILDPGKSLYSSALLKLGDEKYVWYLCQHHIIADAQSFALVFKFMADRYELALQGRLQDAPSLHSYADYISHGRKFYDTPAWRKASDYWRAQIEKFDAPASYYGSPEGARNNRTERVTVDLGPERSAALREMAGSKDFASLSPAMSLASLWATLIFGALHRITGERNLRIGTPFQARPNQQFKETIGAFVEIGVLNAEVEENCTFASLYKQVLRSTIEGLRFARPGISSAEMNRSYSVLLNYVTATFDDFLGMPVQTDWIHSGYGDSNHAVRIQVCDFDQTGSFLLYLDVNEDVFHGARRNWLVEQITAVVDAFLEDPQRSVGSFDLLNKDERQRLIRDFNRTEDELTDATSIVTLFEDRVRESPDAVAAIHGEHRWSYRALDERANQFAAYLKSLGVDRGGRVAVCMHRSLDVLAAIWGVLKTGAAFCPIDPGHPAPRKRELLEDLQPVAVIVQDVTVLNGELAGKFEIVELDRTNLNEQPKQSATPTIAGEELAYLIYTSGSTGKPKAAMLSHAGLVNYVCWAEKTYLQGKSLDFPLYSSLAFDLTLTSIFVPLLAGSKIHIYSEQDHTPGLEILSVFADDAVDVVKLTPSHLELLRHHGINCKRIQKLIVGGENFKTNIARSLLEENSRFEIYNEYGPTEATVGCMVHHYDLQRDRQASVPIGSPAANTHIYVRDEYDQPVPSGVTGEMVISSPGVALGYWNRPELSARRFGTDATTGQRLYRTGDLARWDERGIEFLGRADDQVKIRGVRVELGELEAKLLEHPEIEAAAVALHPAAGSQHAQQCSECGLPDNYPNAGIDASGVCADCRDYADLKDEVDRYFRTPAELRSVLDDLKQRHADQPYDCIALTSGGKDSTYMLYQLVRSFGMRPLVFTLDNGYISERALSNVRLACEDLGVDLEVGRTPHMADIFADSLRRHCNVCHGCFKTIYTLSMSLARRLGIGSIVTGLSRGQLFETRLADTFRARQFDPDKIDRLVKDARKVYHHVEDAVYELIESRLFDDDDIFDEVRFVDFYRYVDVGLGSVYDYLENQTIWQRPQDTGRSTNCLINDVGIYIHKRQRGYHNYALPYSWDVRLGHKKREAALDELNDDIDEARVKKILEEIGYEEQEATETRNGPTLVAYYVSKTDLSPRSLKEYLSSTLPGFMVPTHLLPLDSLPLTRNGKVDRKSLPDPTLTRPELETRYIEATTPLQQQLVAIWQNVMDVEQIGIEDNFFELGGDSVMCIQIAAQAQDSGLDLTPRALFLHPTVAELARLLLTEETSLDATPTAALPAIMANSADIERVQAALGEAEFSRLEELYPLTPTQTGMLYHCLASIHRNLYVGQVTATLQGRIDVDKLQLAYSQLTDAHPILRTRFFWEGLDDPLQAVVQRQLPAWDSLDWSAKPGPQFAGEIDLLKTRIRNAGFDLAGAPPLNMTVVQESDRKVHLIWTTHHILFDGWSAYPLFNEWLKRYDGLTGGEVQLHPPRPFKDYIGWLNRQDDEKSNDFWRRQLAGLTEPTLLPIGNPGATPSERRGKHELALGRGETKALEKLARRKQVTLNAVFQAAWAILLNRYCDQSDVVFGLTHSGRNADLSGIDRMVGLFINTLPVHLAVNPRTSLDSWLPEVHEKLLAIGEFEYSSLAEIQQIAGHAKDQLLFDSIVVFENYPTLVAHQIPGVTLGPLGFTAPSHYPLAVLVYPNDNMKISFIYDDARFKAEEIDRLSQHLRTLLAAMVADTSRQIKEIPLLTKKESDTFFKWRRAATLTLPDEPLHVLIDNAARKNPHGVAVTSGDEQLSYSELQDRSNAIAARLRKSDIAPGSLVGVMAHRTPATVAGILAILKSGAAFVPIDPAYPAGRMRDIIKGANLTLILSDGEDQTGDIPADVLNIAGRNIEPCGSENHSAPVAADDLAYVLYTSGTTGQPKGVMVSHRNIVHSTTARLHYYPDHVKAFMHLSSFAFDSAMAGLFWTLCDGGTLILPDQGCEHDVGHLLELMQRHRASHLLTLPAFYEALMEAATENELPDLAVAIVAGEACPSNLFSLHRFKCPKAELFNEYGPTEATVWSHVYRFPSDFAGGNVSIGTAIANVAQHVLDSEGRPVPIGVPGELVLGGEGIAGGYLGREDLTREKFVSLPAATGADEARYYRTGDLVSWRSDGNLDFVGRIDEQLKIRGFRVEPGEVEATLLQHPNISAVAVGQIAGDMERDPNRGTALVAWYVASQPVSPDDLERLVAASLPTFMRPSRFFEVDAIPHLPNGKVDRRRLSVEYATAVTAERSYRAPESPLQEALCTVWSQLLNVEKVGLEDNFFELGGDSITALRVAARMHRLGWSLRLSDIIDTANLRELAEAMDSSPDERIRSGIAEIPRAADRRRFPMSSVQSRLWFLEQMEASSGANIVYGVYRLRGHLDSEKLRKALTLIADRHEILRTIFVTESDEPWQVVLQEFELDWQREEIHSEAALQDRLWSLVRHEFDLSARPPWLARLIQHGNDHVLVLIFHHIIMDGESIPVMLRDVSELYSAGDVSGERANRILQYGDYANWQVDANATGANQQALDFWQGELSGTLPTLDFPSFTQRPIKQTFAGAVASATLEAHETRRLKRYAESRGMSLYNLLLASFSAALMRYCSQSEVVIGTPIGSARHVVGAEQSLGPYINTVAIRLQPDSGWSFDELGDYVQQKSTVALEHSAVPFETVVAALDLPRDLSRTPVFQALFAFRSATQDKWNLPGIDEQQEFLSQGVARTDLSCWVTEEDQEIRFDIEFATALYDQDVVSRFLNQFLRALLAVPAKHDQSWARMPLLGDEEVSKLLRRRGPSEVTSLDQSICDLIWAAADEFSNRVAVTSTNGQLSYTELRRRSMALAANLRGKGVRSGDIVGLAVTRTERLPLTMLGILQAGAAYVPLDLSLPAERLKHVICDSGLTFVVGDTSTANLLPGFAGTSLTLDDLDVENDAGVAGLTGVKSGTGIAYLMYTSGSTGLPKGVEVGHRQVVNFLSGLREPLAMQPNDVLAAITTTSFDISVLELLLPLCSGACVHVVSESTASDGELLGAEMECCGATVMQGTPATWRMLLDAGWSGDERLRVLCGGERLPLDLARNLQHRCGRVWNLYGPTETTVWSTLAEMPDDPRAVSIGYPIQNTRVYVVDDHHELVPDGVKGQLAIGGEGVALGYHGNVDLTRSRFVADPYFTQQRMYLTGDLGRWLPDGSLDHLGRLDTQLKVRGFRIEAGDVENNLSSAHGVAEVAVTKRAGPQGDDRLVAFVVPEAGHELEPMKLRQHLRARLPQYMIPQHFLALDKLPLTPNRKVDYKRLPELGQSATDDRIFVEPTTPEEKTIAALWIELLGVANVSVTDNFFELGGHSLLMAKLAGRMANAFNRDVAIADLFLEPTISGQAKLARQTQDTLRADLPVAREREQFPMSSIQRRLWFLEHFEKAAGVHNIVAAYRLRGELDHTRLEQAFIELARRHEILRTIFVAESEDPYQKIIAEPHVDWRFETIEDDATLEDRLQLLARQHFELSKRPPWFVHLIRDGDEHILLLNVHHLLLDAESLRLMLAEVGARYAGEYSSVPPPQDVLQFGDFASWQLGQLLDGAYDPGFEFWQSELAGELPVLRFPSFVTRPPEQTFAGDTLTLSLDRSLADQLRTLARDQGSTLFNVLLSAFSSVLLRYCHQDELVVGTPVGTVRHQVGGEQSLGPYINTVALRLRPAADWSFDRLIDHVSGKTVRALEHAEVPFEEIVRKLTLPRDLSRTPVFQALFAFRQTEGDDWDVPGVSAVSQTVPLTAARTDLTCWVTEESCAVRIELEYAADLFDEHIVENFLNHLRRFLELAAADAKQGWLQVPLLADAETFLLVDEQYQARRATPKGSILDLVWSTAEKYPERVAVSSKDRSMTYAEMRRRCAHIAAGLVSHGVMKGDVIGLAVSRTERLPLTILGILQAGAAYVPLDSELPADRLRYLLEHSGILRIVTDLPDEAMLTNYSGDLLHLDNLEAEPLPHDAATAQPFLPEENALAYLMYTSGSTGLPKGVEVGHHQVVNLLTAFQKLSSIVPGDVLAAITTTSFDISVLELLLPLCSGACVHVVSERSAGDGKLLGAEIEHCGATLMQGTPATWRMLLDAGWSGASEIRILCGGEALPLSLAQSLRKCCKTLWNVYGPTETTIWSSISAIDTNPTAIDIGKPINNTRIYVLDDQLNPVPVGVEGEIVIGGEGVAFGYRGQADLTEKRFLADPLNSGGRIYRTGDLGRWLPDGRLEHLGRLDTQLKIRGFRIEAGDVEHNLSSAAGVAKVAVTKRTGPQGDDRLVAFVVPEAGHEFEPMKLRRHLRERLPQYMIPQHFLALDKLPLTPNRKVDYQRLPQLEGTHASKDKATPVQTPNERFIAKIWSEVLGADEIFATDNFIELGGHSLLTMRVITRIAQETGVELGPQDLFSRQLGGIAAQLDANIESKPDAGRPPKQTLVGRLIRQLASPGK